MAQIILADFKGKTWTSEDRPETLEQMAIAIANQAFPFAIEQQQPDTSPDEGNPSHPQ